MSYQGCTCLGKYTRSLPGSCLGPAWVLPGSCLGPAWVLPGSCLGPAWVLPGSCLGPAWVLPGSCLGPLLDPVWVLPGSFLGPAWGQVLLYCPGPAQVLFGTWSLLILALVLP
jgi:hypothetical protein